MSRITSSLRPPLRLLLVLVASLAVSVPAVAGTTDAPPSDAVATTVSGPTPGEYRQQILHGVNSFRANHSRRHLPANDCLMVMAQRWANHLAATGEFKHQDLQRVMRECNLTMAAENIARGYPRGSYAVQAWIHSSGHRANLLNTSARSQGMGARQGSNGWVSVQLAGRR